MEHANNRLFLRITEVKVEISYLAAHVTLILAYSLTCLMIVEQKTVLPAPGIPFSHRDVGMLFSQLKNVSDLMNQFPVVGLCLLVCVCYEPIHGLWRDV